MKTWKYNFTCVSYWRRRSFSRGFTVSQCSNWTQLISQTLLSRLEIATVCCTQIPQHVRGHRETIYRRVSPQFIVDKGDNIPKVIKRLLQVRGCTQRPQQLKSKRTGKLVQFGGKNQPSVGANLICDLQITLENVAVMMQYKCQITL